MARDNSVHALHILKDCNKYNGMPGGSCIVRASNVPEIPTGSVVYYTQAFGILNLAWLDSNIVIDAGNGNKAVGRCTVDFSSSVPGICTLNDGIGTLAGFTARVEVGTSPLSSADKTYPWDGWYAFNREP